MPKYSDKHLKPFELSTCMTVRHTDEIYSLLEPCSNKRTGERAFKICEIYSLLEPCSSKRTGERALKNCASSLFNLSDIVLHPYLLQYVIFLKLITHL